MDTPGFQNPGLAQQQRGATFEELCHNYTQERLQTLFHERTFVREMERYKEVLPPFPARLGLPVVSVQARERRRSQKLNPD